MRSTKWNLLALFVLLSTFSAPSRAQDFWDEEFSDAHDAPGDDLNPVKVPEPSSVALLGMGAIGLVVVTRRRRSAA